MQQNTKLVCLNSYKFSEDKNTKLKSWERKRTWRCGESLKEREMRRVMRMLMIWCGGSEIRVWGRVEVVVVVVGEREREPVLVGRRWRRRRQRRIIARRRRRFVVVIVLHLLEIGFFFLWGLVKSFGWREREREIYLWWFHNFGNSGRSRPLTPFL